MPFLLFFLFLILPAGCTMNAQVEGLEAHLRQREEEMARLAGELERTQADLAAEQQESQALRAQLTSSGKSVVPAEQADAFYRLSGILIDPLQSTFHPAGEQGGGEFTVLVTPVDQFQTALRVPGEMTIKVYSQASAKRSLLVEKTFSAAEMMPLWTAGWVSSGFLLQFSAEDILQPSTPVEKILLEATLVTADERKFATEQELEIRQSKRFPVKAAAKKKSPEIVLPTQLEEKASPETLPAAPAAIETSDRRTIEEFPVYR